MAVVRIGMVGIGSMGLPMALRLQKHGYAVTVCDADARRTAIATRHRLRVGPSPAEAARHSRCTIVTVAGADQVQEVLFGAEGVMHVLARGDCVMLCTTQPPETVERQGSELAARGVHCIDAPLAGGPEHASIGTLPMLVSCDPATFERHRPMLEVLSARLIRVGTSVGLASYATVVNGIVAAVNLAGMAEAMAVAAKVGLDAKQMIEIIESSSGQNWVGSDRFARAFQGQMQMHGRMRQMSQDSRQALGLAESLGLVVPMTHAAAQQYEWACRSGLADADDSRLFSYVREGSTLVEEVRERAPDADSGSDADTASVLPLPRSR